MRLRLWIGCLCVLFAALAPIAASAASIDCAKARSWVEKAICADESLRQGDVVLSLTFGELLDVAADPGAERAAQRKWLAERNACTDAECLATVQQQRLRGLNERLEQIKTTVGNERAALRKQLGWPEECEEMASTIPLVVGTGVEKHDLGQGRTLYCIQCGLAAYQATFVAMVRDAPDGPATLMRFPLYDSDDGKIVRSEDTSFAGMPVFDPQHKTLTVFSKARGLGDCGSLVTYAFSEKDAPTVVSARVRGCSDAKAPVPDPEHWPLVRKP